MRELKVVVRKVAEETWLFSEQYCADAINVDSGECDERLCGFGTTPQNALDALREELDKRGICGTITVVRMVMEGS